MYLSVYQSTGTVDSKPIHVLGSPRFLTTCIVLVARVLHRSEEAIVKIQLTCEIMNRTRRVRKLTCEIMNRTAEFVNFTPHLEDSGGTRKGGGVSQTFM